MKLCGAISVLLAAAFTNHVCSKQLFTNMETFDFESNEIVEQTDDEGLRSNRSNVERINLTLPGTKWCGPGNVADDYDDLGKHEDEDKCCREHDHCDNIASGEEKYGLKNDDYFTR